MSGGVLLRTKPDGSSPGSRARSAGLQTGIARKRETRTDTPGHANLTAITNGAPTGSRMERRSPTGIARERETRPNNPTREPPIPTPRIASAKRRSPTGIARERETRPNNPAPPPISRLQTHASPTAQNHADMEQVRRWGPPTGIARERETRPNDPAPRQSHAYKPTHRQPHRITGTWSAGQFARSPTGIARERETRTDDPAPRQSHGLERRSPTGTAARSAAKTA